MDAARLTRREVDAGLLGDRREEGAALGGLAVGVLLSMVTGYLGSTLAPIAVLALLVVVLIARPSGIFSARQARQA